MEDQDRDQVGVNGEPTVPASDRAATGSPPGGDDADTRTDTDDSFDRLLQEHVARSSDLMRQALALQSRSEVEIARARAEAYASAAGLKVARVLAIRDSGEGGHMPYVGDAMVMEQASAPPPVSAAPFRPGMNASEVRVRADFALGPR